MNPPTQLRLKNSALVLLAATLCASCASSLKKLSDAKPGTDNKDATLVKASSPTDLGFLLSMSFVEAKSISTQQLEFPPHLKIAADSIEVMKYGDDGKPRKARARGKVFIEMNFNESAKALCQEAYITSDEIILRGSPILQRGGSMVEGLDDSTIFYMFGTSLRVIGLHRVNNQNEIASVLPSLGTWAQGPNPLLPPLTESAVPANIRDSMQRAAEAEMLHQQTREIYGPAGEPAAAASNRPPETKPDPETAKEKPKGPEKAKSAPPPDVKSKTGGTTTAKTKGKPPALEVRRALPSDSSRKKYLFSQSRPDKSRT